MHGIEVDAWARLDGDCPMKVEVIAAEAQFEIGNRGASLSLVAEEAGLARLISVASDALARVREQSRS
jgi:hypothetical protein